MQPFVHSVFFVVVSVIATLLVAGLSGIIAILLMDRTTGPRLTAHEPDEDRGVTRVVQRPRASSAPGEFSTNLRTSH
jgi:hypothetical protein